MQTKDSDLVRKLAETSGRERIDVLLELSHHNWETGKLIQAWDYVQEAQFLSEESGYEMGVGQAHGCKAKIHYSGNKIDQALEEGFIALSIFRKINDKIGLSTVMNNLGVFHSAMGMKKRSLDYYHQSNELDPDNVFAINNIGEILEEDGKVDEALAYYLKTRDMAENMKSNRVLCLVHHNLGRIYTVFEDYEKALKMFDIALKWSIELNLNYDFINTNIGIGEIHRIYGDFDKAQEFLLIALKKADTIDNDEYRSFCYTSLIKLYKASKNVNEQNKYLELQLEVNKRLYSGKVTDKLVQLEAAYNLEKKDLESRKLIEQSAKLASIGVMAAGITHEINQPLNAIKVSADSILFWDKRNKGVIPDLFIKELNNISKGALRIDEIIQHMRSFWITPDFHVESVIDVNDAVESGLSLLKRQISAHGINLRKYLAQEKLLIKADMIYLEQIVINLVTNSITALDKTGKSDKYVAILTSLVNNNVHIVFRDNGTGISTEKLEQLYDPFYSTSAPGNGMGLGLAIVKYYLDRCSGRIVAENNEEGGATFKLIFPLTN